MTSYEQGFNDKCAAHGIDPNQLVKLLLSDKAPGLDASFKRLLSDKVPVLNTSVKRLSDKAPMLDASVKQAP